MDERDELQQERDIAEGWRWLYFNTLNKLIAAEAELAELKSKQTYAGWGKKDANI